MGCVTVLLHQLLALTSPGVDSQKGLQLQFNSGLSTLVEIHHATVDREHQDTLKAIAGMQAWTVSWSNVCDYYTPAEFHALARACSAAEDTVHYGYSMNWTRSVKGASSLDYFGNRVALEGLLDQANKAIEFTYKAHGLQDLLLSPPNNNIMNIADS
eukprot:6478864-Pyramimonas_sp.AAC.1